MKKNTKSTWKFFRLFFVAVSPIILMTIFFAFFALPAKAQTTTNQAFEDAKAFGKSQIAGTKGKISNSSGTSNVPLFGQSVGGTTQHFGAGQGATYGLGVSKMTQCDTNPATGTPYENQECEAVNFMAKSPSARPQMPISKQDPIITEGTRITNNMGTILGPTSGTLSGTYSSCATETKTTGAQFETVHCDKTDNQEDNTCAQNLSVTVITTNTAALEAKSCPNGVLVGNYCQATNTGTALQNYVCPSGQTLNGSTCTSTSTTAATPIYTCAAGSTLTAGNTCTTPTNVVTPAILSSYSCTAPSVVQGSSCVTTTTSNAVIASYACPAGQSISGSTCVATTTTTSAATANPYCAPPGVLSGTNCTTVTSSPATYALVCPLPSVLVGSQCVTTTVATAVPTFTCYGVSMGGLPSHYNYPYYTTTGLPVAYIDLVSSSSNGCVRTCPTNQGSHGLCPYIGIQMGTQYAAPSLTSYICPSGTTQSGNTCSSTSTSSPIGSYSCPLGGTANGTVCTITTTTAATQYYTCPAGQTVTGITCTLTTTTTSSATPNYACPAGQAISGNTCTKTTTTAATPIYTCPAGSIVNGSTCVSPTNVVTPASLSSYACTAPAVVQGSSCVTTTTSTATAVYSCPAGATLSGTGSGSICTTVTTTSATINYSCIDGSAPIGAICRIKSTNQSWISTCTPYENQSGKILGKPE